MTRRLVSAVLLAALHAEIADARLSRLVVETREQVQPARPGAPAYEILRGHYEGSLRPEDGHNRTTTDLAHARPGRAPVGYSATFAIARPVDPARGSGVLFYDVSNRGNGSVGADPDGHIRVISGWQGDLPSGKGLQTATVPAARGVTVAVLQRFTDIAAGTASVAITGSIGRPTPRPTPVTLDTRRARLSSQASDTAPAVAVAPGDWAFADCSVRPFPGVPDPAKLCVRGGFAPNRAYTLVYRGRDPLVLGIGFAAVRDLNAFLLRGSGDAAGNPNPVAGRVRWSIVIGTSQSGNFVKSFINLGFNQDEDGDRVFAGANPDIAARQVPLNIRGGVPGGAASLFEPGSEGTLWWSRHDDRARGRGVHALLDRCRATATCPRIMETFGAAEFWGLRMSPALVGTDAARDLPLPDEVRRYYFPGTTHGGSAVGGFPLAGDPPFPAGGPRCTLALNPNPSSDTRRALLARLVDWVTHDRAPPPSRYPTLARGELVEPTAAAMGWPAIPGVPMPDGKINVVLDYDFGPGFHYADLSGVADQPPTIRRTIPSRVPRVDADGNEVGGVASVQMRVPIGSYTGWNELAQGYGAGGACGFVGGFVPFARTRAERVARGDPRPSLEERYLDHAGFVARVRAAAAADVAGGWLLADDAARIVGQAEASDVLRR